MIFFLIVPVWLLILCGSAVLFIFKPTRWLAAYIAISSTLSVVSSFIASLLGLFGLAALGNAVGARDWTSLFAVGGYGIGLLAGGFIGAIVGFLIVAFFHYRSWKKRLD